MLTPHYRIAPVKPENSETEKLIRLYYVEQKLGLEKAASKMGHTAGWMIARLKGLGIPIRGRLECHKKYKVNENYFERIDSHEKALVLGFIYADGCVHLMDGKTFRMQIALQHRDIDYLEYIKGCLDYEGPVRTHLLKRNGRYYSYLNIGSDKMCRDLIKLGCHERKSLVSKFPTEEQVPREFLSSFICGFFDGDGGYGLSKKPYVDALSLSFAISYDMALVFQDYLKDQLRVHAHMSKEPRDEGKDPRTHIWKLRTGGNPQTLRLADWMYSHAPFKMKRKYDIYLSVRQHYDENLVWIKPAHWLQEVTEKARINSTGRVCSEETKRRMKASALSNKNRNKWHPLSIKSPSGQVYHSNCCFKLYKEILKDLGLHNTYLSKMASGKITCYKGYTIATPAEVAAARENGTLVEKIY